MQPFSELVCSNTFGTTAKLSRQLLLVIQNS